MDTSIFACSGSACQVGGSATIPVTVNLKYS
jgi:hypothetical protein